MPDSVTLIERTGIAFASIHARKTAAADDITASLGIALPPRPGIVCAEGCQFIGTGRGTWLAVTDNRTQDWPCGLQNRLRGLCAVCDQSGAYVALRLTGPGARNVLQRGAFIDLHENVFGAGDAATLTMAHLGVVIWQTDATPVFDLAVPRSTIESFRQSLVF